jgi:hypothetical protein
MMRRGFRMMEQQRTETETLKMKDIIHAKYETRTAGREPTRYH